MIDCKYNNCQEIINKAASKQYLRRPPVKNDYQKGLYLITPEKTIYIFTIKANLCHIIPVSFNTNLYINFQGTNQQEVGRPKTED